MTGSGERARRELAPCPDTPNCVSSRSEHPANAMAPLAAAGTTGEIVERLVRVIRSFPRARVIDLDEDYVRAEFSSRLFGFVDDVELVVDAEAGRVHFRSASRVGRYDFGVNRRRMRTLAKRFATAGGR